MTKRTKLFSVGDFFEIKPTKRHKQNGKDLTNHELFKDASTAEIKTRVIVNSAFNNGVGGYSNLEKTEDGQMITFSDTVDANTIFYQEFPFIGYPHVQGVYPLNKDKWKKYQLIYFATVFKKVALAEGFNFGNKFRRDVAIKLKVPLPITDNNEPDWDYMETYMMKIENKVNSSLKCLVELVE